MPKVESKKRTYTAYVRVNLEVGMDVVGSSLEEALAAANSLKLEDVVEMHGEHCDSEMLVRGVYINGAYCSDGLK